MLILLITLCCLNATGIVYHEAAGIALLGLAGAHLLLNRRWIRGIGGQLGKRALGGKTLRLAVLNSILFLDFTIIIITGLCVSQVILPLGGGSGFMLALHKWSAYACIALCFVHVTLHRRYIAGLIQKLRSARTKTWGTISAIGAMAVIAGMLYGQIASSPADSYIAANTNAAASANALETGQGAVYEEKPDDEEQTINQNDSAAAEAVTLSDFLGKLYCTACHKRCSLLAPRCGRGERQVQKATVEYQNSYGSV